MFYDLQRLPHLPVIIGSWFEGFTFPAEGEQFMQELYAQFDALPAPVFYILDLSQLHTITFDGLVKAASSGAREANSPLHHPMNRGTIIVTDKAIIQTAAKGLNSAPFGNVDVKLVESLDEALNYVRETA